MSAPSALREAAGGVAIEYGLLDGPLVFTLSAHEASRLATAITSQLDASERRLIDRPKRVCSGLPSWLAVACGFVGVDPRAVEVGGLEPCRRLASGERDARKSKRRWRA